jgi:putative ATP-dependent endonuclease of OLD family
LQERRDERRAKASGQRVETFVSDQWTLEYDLAFYGLGSQVWLAAHCALEDDRLTQGSTTRAQVAIDCCPALKTLTEQNPSPEHLAAHAYSLFERRGASKTTAAQYLASHLSEMVEKQNLDATELLRKLPPYIVHAIAHVTEPLQKTDKHAEKGDARMLFATLGNDAIVQSPPVERLG